MAILYIFVGLILVTRGLCNFNILHIKPTSNPELPDCSCNSDWPCKTLDEFTDNSTVYLNNNDNLMMVFLPGEHSLTKNLEIKETIDLTMVGANDCFPIFDCMQQPAQNVITLKANLTIIEGSLNLTVSSLTIDGQTQNIVTILTVGIADFVVSIDNVIVVRGGLLLQAQNRLFSNHEGVITLSDMTFKSSTVMFDFEKTNKIALKNVAFFLGSTGNAITFCSLISHVLVQNIEIGTLDSDDESAPVLYCSDLFHNQFRRTCDVVIYLSNGYKDDLNRSLAIVISNSSLVRSFGAGICAPNPPPGNLWSWFLEVTIENSLISNHAEGGIDMETGYLKNLSLSLINTVISSNINLVTKSLLCVYW